MSEATADLLKQGILGILLVIAGTVIFFLYRENKAERDSRTKEREVHAGALAALQAQRVVDAQAVTAQLLRINEACVTALTNNSSMLEATQTAVSELKQAFRDLENEVRQRSPRRPSGG